MRQSKENISDMEPFHAGSIATVTSTHLQMLIQLFSVSVLLTGTRRFCVYPPPTMLCVFSCAMVTVWVPCMNARTYAGAHSGELTSGK